MRVFCSTDGRVGVLRCLRVLVVVVVVDFEIIIMGCGGSKNVDDLPLVVLCRERKELIKAASDH
ncbi:hypothetical protein Ancab_037526, partial [Ancistrocladus abbreviatus]